LIFERRLTARTPAQLALMRTAGLLVGDTLQLLAGRVTAGMTTADLDAIAEENIRSGGGVPSFKGYHGFPASICTSVNDEVVHGIPGGRVLEDGDLLSIDCGAIVEGWHGDSALTLSVGSIRPDDAALSAACEASMWAGIAAAVVGGRLSDIGASVEESVVAARADFGIIEEYTGHGIGTHMHEEPSVPNFGRRGRGPKLVAGAVLAIEPMITAGAADVATLEDDWTVVTTDGRRAAHWEHTVAITDAGPWVLTALDGGAAGLAAIGSPCGAPA
jgi:methionyl aminopeptidase